MSLVVRKRGTFIGGGGHQGEGKNFGELSQSSNTDVLKLRQRLRYFLQASVIWYDHTADTPQCHLFKK